MILLGDFQSGSWGTLTSLKVIGFTAPELTLDDGTEITTGSTGAEHEVHAGVRYKVGNAKLLVAYDEGLLAAAMGSATGAVTSAALSWSVTDAGGTTSYSGENMVLAKVTPSEIKVKGGQPTIVLEFQKHNIESGS